MPSCGINSQLQIHNAGAAPCLQHLVTALTLHRCKWNLVPTSEFLNKIRVLIRKLRNWKAPNGRSWKTLHLQNEPGNLEYVHFSYLDSLTRKTDSSGSWLALIGNPGACRAFCGLMVLQAPKEWSGWLCWHLCLITAPGSERVLAGMCVDGREPGLGTAQGTGSGPSLS